jgi:succinoglycan biosynthesis transport protein ExoP
VAEETLQGSGLRGLLLIWRRRQWLAILVFAVPMSAGVSFIAFLPNVYRSTATVLVERQQVPETIVQSTVTSTLETRLQTISQEILSRSRLEALINRFGLYPVLRRRAPLEDVIERMRGDIKLELKGVEVRGQRQATVAFTISYLGGDADTVSVVTNTLASFYIEENLKVRERLASGTADFLKIQLTETKKKLDDLEHRVGDFKRRHLGELPQQMETNLASLERLHTQLRINADNQTRSAERRHSLSGQLAEAETLLATTPIASIPLGAPAIAVTDTPELRRVRLKQELTTLRTQYNDRYPDVVAKKAELAALEREIAEARARDAKDAPGKDAPGKDEKPGIGQPPTPYVLRLKESLSEAEADIKVFKSEERRLRESIASYQTRVENVPRREQELRELSRDYDSTGALYQSLLKRFEEAQLAESLEQRQKGEQFRVLDPAIPGPTPDAPKRARLLLIALVGSIGLAIGAAMLAEHFDMSFHSVDELRAFSGVPVLVSIPRIGIEADRVRQRRRARLTAGAAFVGLVLIVGSAYLIAHGNEQLVSVLGRAGS